MLAGRRSLEDSNQLKASTSAPPPPVTAPLSDPNGRQSALQQAPTAPPTEFPSQTRKARGSVCLSPLCSAPLVLPCCRSGLLHQLVLISRVRCRGLTAAFALEPLPGLCTSPAHLCLQQLCLAVPLRLLHSNCNKSRSPCLVVLPYRGAPSRFGWLHLQSLHGGCPTRDDMT